MLAQELGVTSVKDVVEHMLGLEGVERGSEYELRCPHPAHDDTSPSAAINLTTGLWHCFSCGRGGDLAGLYAVLKGMRWSTAVEELRPNTPEALLALLNARMQLHTPLIRPTKHVPVPPVDCYPDAPLDALLERGLSRQTLGDWEVRYVPTAVLQGHKREFTIYASIGIPIRDERGRLIAWCYRRTDRSPDWQPKYLITGGAKVVNETWFGLDRNRRTQDIVVVEGAIDAMWCQQAGIPTIALLGADMGRRKLLRLQEFRSVTLLGDMDKAGAIAVHRIGRAVGTLTSVRVATYSSWMRATDPAELSSVDLEIAVERAMPWTRWTMAQQDRVPVS